MTAFSLAPALPLALPLAGGALLSVLGRTPGAVRRAVAGGALAANLALALVFVVLADRGATLALGVGGERATVALELVLDRLAAWMLLLTAAVAVLGFAYACGAEEDRERPRLHACALFQLFGFSGCFLAADLFGLLLFAEVTLLASYALAHGRGRWSAGDGPVVLLQLAGSTLFVGGIGCVHAALGSIRYAELAYGAPATAALEGVLSAGGVLLLAGLVLKATLLLLAGAGAPQRAPTLPPVLTIMAVAYALLRLNTLVLPCLGAGPCGPVPALVPLGLGTLAAGIFGALTAEAFRPLALRLLLVPLGWLLIAIGSGRDLGLAAAVYGLAHTALAGAAIGLATDQVARDRAAAGDRLIADTSRVRPPLTLLYGAAAAGVVGLPPLSGFIMRLAILQAAAADALVVWSVVLATSLGGLIVAIRATGALAGNAVPATAGPRAPRQAALVVATAVALQAGLALAAGPAFEFADRTVRQLVDRAGYVAAARAAQRLLASGP